MHVTESFKLRIFTEPQQGATYDDLLRVARATEECGFDAFFRSDHFLAMGVPGEPGPTDSYVTLAGLARGDPRRGLTALACGRGAEPERAGPRDEQQARDDPV